MKNTSIWSVLRYSALNTLGFKLHRPMLKENSGVFQPIALLFEVLWVAKQQENDKKGCSRWVELAAWHMPQPLVSFRQLHLVGYLLKQIFPILSSKCKRRIQSLKPPAFETPAKVKISEHSGPSHSFWASCELLFFNTKEENISVSINTQLSSLCLFNVLGLCCQ